MKLLVSGNCMIFWNKWVWKQRRCQKGEIEKPAIEYLISITIHDPDGENEFKSRSNEDLASGSMLKGSPVLKILNMLDVF